MALKYEEVSRFARENGNVTAWAEKSAVTLLRDGQVDSVAFFEKDAIRFEHEGKSYSREDFEKLLRANGR